MQRTKNCFVILRTGKERGDRVPALPHVLRGGEDNAFEASIQGVDAVVE